MKIYLSAKLPIKRTGIPDGHCTISEIVLQQSALARMISREMTDGSKMIGSRILKQEPIEEGEAIVLFRKQSTLAGKKILMRSFSSVAITSLHRTWRDYADLNLFFYAIVPGIVISRTSCNPKSNEDSWICLPVPIPEQ